MKLLRSKNKFALFIIICCMTFTFSYIRAIILVPGELTLFEDEEYLSSFKSPFLVIIEPDKEGMVQIGKNEDKTALSYIQMSSPVHLKTNKEGRVTLRMYLLGLIPLKTMRVDVVPNKKLVACGNTIGVKLKADGILVIGISDVESANKGRVIPAKDSGIMPGDLITAVNGKNLHTIDNLIKEIDRVKDGVLKIEYIRGQQRFKANITPVKAQADGKYKIGLWVRDSTAGIGTLTFYEPETLNFGALGHGITDIDTGILMASSSGEILESSILGIKKGTQGSPGELKGVFIEDEKRLGIIKMNTESGIYGTLTENGEKKATKRLYPIGLRSEVQEGPAVILSNIDGNSVKEYDVEIERVSRQNVNGTKGMIIRITDESLLKATGGIVQGMSGSPIIQNGKLVGAVTHVLVNDPAKGYGIFIEAMVKNIAGNKTANLEKAG
jgi:stage IV sporulation protein B